MFSRKEDSWQISIRYFQNIVNDVRDLLSPLAEARNYKAGLHKDNQGFMEFGWLTRRPVNSFEELCVIIQDANRRKAIAATQFNHQSTRGHCILQLELNKPESSGSGQVHCRLYVCDLAGTEPAADIFAAYYERVSLPDGTFEYKFSGRDLDQAKTQELQDQGKKINLSLTEMAQFFMKMAGAVKQKKLSAGASIPGCSSYFLCKYLKDTMLQAKTYLFCAIRPEVKFHTYTYSTLGFAKNASVVKLKPRSGVQAHSAQEQPLLAEISNFREELELLQRENESLKRELAAASTAESSRQHPDTRRNLTLNEYAEEQSADQRVDDIGSSISTVVPGLDVPALGELDDTSDAWKEQQDQYAQRGISLTHFDANTPHPHFRNITEDPFYSDRFMFIFHRSETVIGIGGDIEPLSAQAVQQVHSTRA